jgi:hypothetical protein
MDRYKYDQQQLKAGRFPRSYKEATGCDYHDDSKRTHHRPLTIFLFILVILIGVL